MAAGPCNLVDRWPVELQLADENATETKRLAATVERIPVSCQATAHGRKPVRILLVEDNPGDVRLAVEVLRECDVPSEVSVVSDGVEALAFLHQENPYSCVDRPDVILLDLNLPRKDGREVLAELKSDSRLKRIPVVVLTTSDSETDVNTAYDLNANCYITKPAELQQFVNAIESIQNFWSALVRLPERP
jgi:two-component system, chemotaxis family, response regulator Rcp1